jgi:peptidoglycan/LPS O-acetylase OafA/YrhL
MIVVPAEPIGPATGKTAQKSRDSTGATGTPSKAAYRGDIDGLRAVAVTLVVLFHIGWGAFPAGYVGVDVFYVISGYLITGLLIRELSTTGTISIAGFYARRIRRLLPLSAVVLLATAVGSHFLTPTLDRPGVGSDIRAAALYFANWHFAGEQTQYMADTSKSPVLHYWSLSVEEQFYVVWPLLLLLVVGTTGLALRRWEIARRRIVLALGVVAAVSFVLSATTSVSSGPWAYFGLHTRGWELAVGAGLALAGSSLARLTRVQAVALGWVGLVLVIGSAVLMSGDTIFPGTAAAFPVFGTAMVMGAGVAASGAGVGRFLSLPGPRYVGRISYAWYLWHWPCIVLIGGLNDDAAGAAGDQAASGGSHDALRMAAAVVLSLALSVLTHHVVENPARRSPRLVGNRRLSLVLGVVLTAAGVVGSVLLVPALNGGGGTTADGVSVESALKARTDLEPVPNGCYQELATLATPHDCQFGDPDGKRTIVLAGDSNARHWFGAYAKLAKARHWKFYFWGKSGCPMVDAVIWLGTTRSAYDSCTTWRDDVRDEIKRLGTVDAVVLARSRALGHYVMVDSENRAKTSELQPTWEKDVATTLDELSPLTRHIVFMKPTPTAPLDVPACIADGPETARSRCEFPQGPAIRDTPLDRAEEAAIQGQQGVSMLDVNQKICGSDPCPVISDSGKIIYFNENHLTATFARTLSPVVARGLQAALGPDRSDATQ